MFELIRKLLEEQKEVWAKCKYYSDWRKVESFDNDWDWVCLINSEGYYAYLGEFEIVGIHIGDPTKEG